MTVRDLFRYQGANGVVDTLIELPMEGERRKRLDADPGMMLTDGEIVTKVHDIPAADIDNWSEIEAEVDTEAEATEADYIAALNELGVNTDEES